MAQQTFYCYNLLGVATFCRHYCTPTKAEEGLAGTLPSKEFFDSVGCYGDIAREFSLAERKDLDAEGRAILTQHDIQVTIMVKHFWAFGCRIQEKCVMLTLALSILIHFFSLLNQHIG